MDEFTREYVMQPGVVPSETARTYPKRNADGSVTDRTVFTREDGRMVIRWSDRKDPTDDR